MSRPSVSEPLRDQIGRVLYEEPGLDRDWYLLSEERREPWRQDADRVIPVVQRDYAAVVAERDRAQRACEQIAGRLGSAENSPPNPRNEGLPKLLRAIASGEQAKENKHDVILMAAADEIERRRTPALTQPTPDTAP